MIIYNKIKNTMICEYDNTGMVWYGMAWYGMAYHTIPVLSYSYIIVLLSYYLL